MLNGNLRRWRATELSFLMLGLSFVGVYSASKLDSKISSRIALQEFRTSVAPDPARTVDAEAARAVGGVDVSLWSEKRIRAYAASLIGNTNRPEAVLLIRRLLIEVPVFDGTDDLTLNRGVGRIIGTARVGSPGNTALAGHRDGFFRALKDIVLGDAIELVTPERNLHYVVERTEIVSPRDASVLAGRGANSLCLVTCFPFYFVGDAPKRFVVHAKSIDNHGPAIHGSASLIQTNSEEKKL